MPEGGNADADVKLLKEALTQLLQAQVGLLRYPLAQLLVMTFKAGAPVPAALPGLHGPFLLLALPVALHAALGDPENTGQFLGAVATLAARHQALPQIKAVALHATA